MGLLRKLGRKLGKFLFDPLPARVQGLFEYYLRPGLRRGFGPLNGQVIRQRIFEKIVAEFDVARIVETGTYRGTTTEYFATFGLPVESVEVNKRFYAFSRKRLAHLPNVSLYDVDSQKFLEDRIRVGTFSNGLTVFYLDAHWEKVLPLADELGLICGNLEDNIVVIDDFEVPGDPGYGFDDYGPGRRLCVDYLKTVPGKFDFYIFFPKEPSGEETGYKRGTAFVTSNVAIAEKLTRFMELRPFDLTSGRYVQSSDTISGMNPSGSA